MWFFDRLIKEPNALKPPVVFLFALIFLLADGFLLHRYLEKVALVRDSAARYQPTSQLGSAQDEAHRPMAIFLGDSFTEGAGGTRHGGYVSTAGKVAGLDALPSGMGATGIVNDYGGRGGRVKFRDRLYRDVIALKPDVVVIAGGVNDTLMVANGTVTPSQYRSEYDALIQQIKRSLPEAKIVVLGPFCPGTPSSYTGMTQIRDLNRAAARAAGVPFIDVFYFTDANRDRYTSEDGFHLNDAGYEYLGKKLGADLVRVLRQREPSIESANRQTRGVGVL
jgi:lysophospholipase L1-like esterase